MRFFQSVYHAIDSILNETFTKVDDEPELEREKGHGCSGELGGGFVNDQTRETIHPTTVHPSRRFKARMAPRL